MPGTNPIDQLKRHFITESSNMESSFQTSNQTGHPGDTGTNREDLLATFLNNHLPAKYEALLGGKVFDTEGNLTEQVDVLVYDKNTPRLGTVSRQLFLAEGVATAIEVKPELNMTSLEESIRKINSFKKITKSFNAPVTIGQLQTRIYSGAFAYTLGTSKENVLNRIIAVYQNTELDNCIDFICINKQFVIVKNIPGEWSKTNADGTSEPITDRFMIPLDGDLSLYYLLMLISQNSIQNYLGSPDYSKYINIK
jgi:hypothetical protein